MTPDALKRDCEKKYGGQFSLQAWRTETMYAHFQEALFSASKLGGATVTVRAFPDGTIADNFLAVQYRAQTQEALAKLAEPIYGPVTVVNVPNRDVTESPPADTSFSSYIASRDSAVYCAVYTHADPARRNPSPAAAGPHGAGGRLFSFPAEMERKRWIGWQLKRSTTPSPTSWAGWTAGQRGSIWPTPSGC